MLDKVKPSLPTPPFSVEEKAHVARQDTWSDQTRPKSGPRIGCSYPYLCGQREAGGLT